MKALYVVTGSEDGVIAASTSAKRAALAAWEYVANSCDEPTPTETVGAIARDLKRSGIAFVTRTDNHNFGLADVERFWDGVS